MTVELTPGQAYINSLDGQVYAQFTRGLHTAIVNFSDDSEEIETDDVAKIIRDDVPLMEANSVGSRYLPSPVWTPMHQHKPVLDLDMDVLLVPSSTPGHHHLYIDKPMPWHEYSLLLNVLAHVGILQPNYVRACHGRSESWLRTPWTKKGS